MTAKQRALLVFIHRTVTETGVTPSYREMAAGIGLQPHRAPNIHALLKTLEKDGWVRMAAWGRSRSVQVLRAPECTLNAAEVAWCHDHADQVRGLMAAPP